MVDAAQSLPNVLDALACLLDDGFWSARHTALLFCVWR
jgi:hypothetical protein